MAARAADLRIGDADREAGAASLREHYAQGRLSLEEFNERLDAVFAATTQGQLDQVTSDLPHVRTPSVPLPVTAANAGGERGRHADARSRMGMVGGLVAILGIWLLVLLPTLTSFRFFALPSRFPLLLIGLLIIRSLGRRILGGLGGRGCGRRRGRWDGRSAETGRFTGPGHGHSPSGRPW